MTRVVFPDALEWQSGLEFGLAGVARLQDRASLGGIVVRDHGPFLEAVVCAALDYSLRELLVFVPDPLWNIEAGDLAVFPRVRSSASSSASSLIAACRGRCPVLVSDAEPLLPADFRFRRRDPEDLARALDAANRAEPFPTRASARSL